MFVDDSLLDDALAQDIVVKEMEKLSLEESFSMATYATGYHEYLGNIIMQPNRQAQSNASMLNLRKQMAANSRSIANELSMLKKRTHNELNK